MYANNITMTGSTVSNSTAHASFGHYPATTTSPRRWAAAPFDRRPADHQQHGHRQHGRGLRARLQLRPGWRRTDAAAQSITSSEISSNTADVGGRRLSALSAGGGAGNRPAGNASAVTLLNSTVSGNTALLGGGGGIVAFNLPAQVISLNSDRQQRRALGGGGFIDLHDATSYGSSELNGSIIVRSTARRGRGTTRTSAPIYDGTAFVGANNLAGSPPQRVATGPHRSRRRGR